MFFTWDDVVRFVGEFALLEKSCCVSDELRGWNWSDPPILCVSSFRISVSDVVSICDSGRDIFLKYILNVRGKVGRSIVRGFIIHFAFRELVYSIKRSIYNHAVKSGFELLEYLKSEGKKIFFKIFDEFDLSNIDSDEVECLFWEVWKQGSTIYSGCLDKYFKDREFKYLDSIVRMVVPIDVEVMLDGSKIGLTNVRVDAILYPDIPIEIKVGEGIKPELALAGYALVMESIFRKPINFGIVVNVDIKNDLTISWKYRIVHIDDNLRLEFINERDRRLEILENKIDPGISSRCISSCPFYEYCHGKKVKIEKKAQERPSKKLKIRVLDRD